jgi:hypothetical protein
MGYPGWNLEKTLLVHGTAGARPCDLIDVRLPVKAVAATNLPNDVRVVLKQDWNVIEREVPSQAYAVRQHGRTASFRVAFSMDVPGVGDPPQRVGIYYDNPDALPADYPSPLQVEGDGLGVVISTPHCMVETDEQCGAIRMIAGRFESDDGEPRVVRFADVVQQNPAIVFAVEEAGDVGAVTAGPSDWADVEVVDDVRGPVFIKRTCRGRPGYPGCPSSRRPVAEVTCRLFAGQPYVLIYTKLMFPEDTNVFDVRVGGLTVGRDRATHYTFRPVSPVLPDTDVEEMGHILVEPELTADLPQGNAFSSLLPYDLAWDAFLDTREGRAQGIACIQLRHALSSPDGPFPAYRSATYLERAERTLRSSRSPIHVTVRDRRENMVTIPAGTVIEELDAVVCDLFDPDWGNRTDAAGRRLNIPQDVAVHPRFMGGEVPPEPFEPLPHGERHDAYLRSGVR